MLINGKSSLEMKKQFKHGLNGYNTHKCRCDICRNAKAVYRNTDVAKLQKKKDNANWWKNKGYKTVYGNFDLNELYKTQEGKCPICNKKLEFKYHIDHCHKTGKVRGLLHPKCNVGLGFFDENILFFINAIKYILKHKKSGVLFPLFSFYLLFC